MSVDVRVIGRLTRNPESGKTQGGATYASISVAGNEGAYENQETFFFDASIFGRRGETVLGYQKGDLVAVSGHLHEYQGNNGNTYKSLRFADIELLQRAHPEDSNYQQGNYQQQQMPQNQGNFGNNQQQPPVSQPQQNPGNFPNSQQGQQQPANPNGFQQQSTQVDTNSLPFAQNKPQQPTQEQQGNKQPQQQSFFSDAPF